MDELQNNCVEWKMYDKQNYKLYDFIYILF